MTPLLVVAAAVVVGAFLRRRRARRELGEVLVERHAEIPAGELARALRGRK